MKKRQLTLQFCSISAFLAIITLLWPDWIEIVSHIDPDQDSGSLERLIVGLAIVLTLTFLVLARREWRRAALSSV